MKPHTNTSHRGPAFFRALTLTVGAVAVLLTSASAQAFPGFFVGKKQAERINHSTHVVLYKKADVTGVTVMVDYEGPLNPFAIVMPVPADVALESVKPLKRDIVDHMDQITAPRFHEFWEMDPCDPEELQQEWQRDLRVKKGAANFLGGGADVPMGKTKLPKEMLLTVQPDFKEAAEYKFALVPAAELKSWLDSNGYKMPAGVDAKLGEYNNMQMLIAEVDDKRIELTGGDRAILSPIRYVTHQPVKLATRLGLVNADKAQELFVYVIDPKRRYEAKNYPNVFPPTNLLVDFKVKERMGEFYAGLHDRILAKHPKAFVVEYAWAADGCGQPCATEPVMIHEILGFGGQEFEEALSEEERNPKPPEMTEDEKKAFDEAEKEEQEKIKEVREEVARRKALLSRHQGYVLTRLHQRYTAKDLSGDIEFAPAPPIEGGIDLPKGAAGEMATDVKPAKDGSRMQTRFAFLHPNKKVVKCDSPKPYRWGKAIRTYRGLRKTWLAQDIVTKNRTKFDLDKVVHTAYAPLDFKGVALEKEPDPNAAKAEGDGKCACGLVGRTSQSSSAVWASLLLLAGMARRRRRY